LAGSEVGTAIPAGWRAKKKVGFCGAYFLLGKSFGLKTINF